MRISDWSSDVCSSDLAGIAKGSNGGEGGRSGRRVAQQPLIDGKLKPRCQGRDTIRYSFQALAHGAAGRCNGREAGGDQAGQMKDASGRDLNGPRRSEEHTSELQSLMRNSYGASW